ADSAVMLTPASASARATFARTPGLDCRVSVSWVVLGMVAPPQCSTAASYAFSAARAARDPSRLDQLEPRVVGALEKRNARSIEHLRRPFEETSAETGEPRNVGLDVGGVEAEVLQAVMRQCIAGTQLLVGPRSRDVDIDTAISAPAAYEPIAEHAR